MVKRNNKKFCSYNSKRESIADHMVVFKNRKVDFSLISLLFLISMFGTLFLSVEFDTKSSHNIINIVWADIINGTENADNITGTINKDIIKGLDGNDTIYGMQSGDDISGGSGDDIIYGNEGRDVLKGKAGNDILIGGPGNDTLTGGLGKDIFMCGTGADTITDFNITQGDTIPENDCETVRYGSNTESSSIALQQEQQSGVKSGNINSKEIIGNTNTTTKKETNPVGGFFGLFK